MMLNEEEFYDAVETALDKHDEDDENEELVRNNVTREKTYISNEKYVRFVLQLWLGSLFCMNKPLHF